MTVTAVQGDWSDFHHRALERVSQVPGVQRAAFAWGTPLTGNDWPGLIEIEGHPVMKPSDRIALPLRSVTPGYFDLLGLKLVEGRDVRDTDDRKAPAVAVVNQALADRYFAGTPRSARSCGSADATGRRPTSSASSANARTGDLTRAPTPEVYLSLWQSTAFSKDLVVRTAADPRAVIEAIRRELASVDPTVAVERVKTLDDIRADSLASRIFAQQLLVGFAIVGTLLTVVGVYGVLALSVAARRREIAIRTRDWRAPPRHPEPGVRRRIPADRRPASRSVSRARWSPRACCSRFCSRWSRPIRSRWRGGALFVAVSVVACWVPTRRAAAVDPLEALRCEWSDGASIRPASALFGPFRPNSNSRFCSRKRKSIASSKVKPEAAKPPSPVQNPRRRLQIFPRSIPLAWKSDGRRPYFASFRDTATPSTSVAGRNPPDWWDQSDA